MVAKKRSGSAPMFCQGVRRAARDEHKRPGRRLSDGVAELDTKRAFEGVDHLVLVVDVQRRTLLPHDERLDRRESTVALVACDLEGEQSTHGILDRQSFARRQNQLSHRLILSAACAGRKRACGSRRPDVCARAAQERSVIRPRIIREEPVPARWPSHRDVVRTAAPPTRVRINRRPSAQVDVAPSACTLRT
jgi:hypothetical protein